MSTYLYTYTMKNDSGFAPSVSAGLLTLACCRGSVNPGKSLRTWVANEVKKQNEVWVMGVCGKHMKLGNAYRTKHKKESGPLNPPEGAPIYLAKIQQAITSKEYFQSNSSLFWHQVDHDAYFVNEVGEITSAGEKLNPHHNNDDDYIKDTNSYVLISQEFIYWGDACSQMIWNNICNALGQEAQIHLVKRRHKKYDITGYVDSLLSACDWNPSINPCELRSKNPLGEPFAH